MFIALKYHFYEKLSQKLLLIGNYWLSIKISYVAYWY